MKEGRLAVAVFAALVLATVGAFYLTQHLKTKNPLIQGSPRADPDVINPRYAGICTDLQGKRASFRTTTIGFYLQSRADTALVSVTDAGGQVIAAAKGSGRHLSVQMPPKYSYYSWDGRETAPGFDGRYAPAGTYGFQVGLLSEGRTFPITDPDGEAATVKVLSARPQPRIAALTVQTEGALGNAGAIHYTPTAPAFTPGRESVRISWRRPAEPYAAVTVLIYRAPADPAQALRLVGAIHASPRAGAVQWDGRLNGEEAPAGSYLIGLRVKDRACVTTTEPATVHPRAGADPGSGINVRYLTALAPATPTAAGHVATVLVDNAGDSYAWALRLNGGARVVAHGHAPGDSGGIGALHLRLPSEGLYALTLRTRARSLTIPLVAAHAHPGAKVLVVLPALSWQGANPVDDDGDGLVDTLTNGQVELNRPLINGLPSGFDDEADLINYLNTQGDRYQLTTDVALAEGQGPALSGFHGVILDGRFAWLPTALSGRLRTFVRNGGAVFNAAVNSLEQEAPVSTAGQTPSAGPATQLQSDPFGVGHGPVNSTQGGLITGQGEDPLGIFTGAYLDLVVPRYQLLNPPAGVNASVAGLAPAAPAIIAFHRGSGTVVEAGLPDFGTELVGDASAQDLLNQVWKSVLSP